TARMNQQQFESFTASSLYCDKCKTAMPVRERLLLVLPDREIFDYLCTGCGSSVGRREVTAGEKMLAQAMVARSTRGSVVLTCVGHSHRNPYKRNMSIGT